MEGVVSRFTVSAVLVPSLPRDGSLGNALGPASGLTPPPPSGAARAFFNRGMKGTDAAVGVLPGTLLGCLPGGVPPPWVWWVMWACFPLPCRAL